MKKVAVVGSVEGRSVLSIERLEQIQGAAWFRSSTAAYLVVDGDFRIRASNLAYDQVTQRSAGSLVGMQLFEAFPDNPADPKAIGVRRLTRSIETVLRSGASHWMGIQRYDIPSNDDRGFIDKVWAPVNIPIREGHNTVGVLHHVSDVTSILDPRSLRTRARERGFRQGARRLAVLFPDLPFDAVLGALVQSHRLVAQVLGSPSGEQAEQLTKLRLEVLAGRRPDLAKR